MSAPSYSNDWKIMPYDSELVTTNKISRERLRDLMARLSGEQYSLPLDSDWTVGTALAHIAFYDRRAIDILEKWEREGAAPSDNDPEIINAALMPFLRLMPPAPIGRLALEYAEILDAKLPMLSDDILESWNTVLEHPFNLSRAKHRNEHLDHIEEALKKT
jgi:hypothetical protein